MLMRRWVKSNHLFQFDNTRFVCSSILIIVYRNVCEKRKKKKIIHFSLYAIYFIVKRFFSLNRPQHSLSTPIGRLILHNIFNCVLRFIFDSSISSKNKKNLTKSKKNREQKTLHCTVAEVKLKIGLFTSFMFLPVEKSKEANLRERKKKVRLCTFPIIYEARVTSRGKKINTIWPPNSN